MKLADKRCVPCEGGVPRLRADAIRELLPAVPHWTAEDDQRLTRRLEFPDFVSVMKFLNELADLAESEGHHPDFSVSYSKLDLSLWTHAIGGLSENDFILAAKIDELLEG